MVALSRPPRSYRPAMTTHRRLLRSASLAVALSGSLWLLPALSGCGASNPKRVANLGTVDKEQELLSSSADLYWEAYRWADGDRAGAFVEDPQRGCCTWTGSEHSEGHKIESAKVLQIILDPEVKAEPGQPLRTATVYVRVKGYSTPPRSWSPSASSGGYRSVRLVRQWGCRRGRRRVARRSARHGACRDGSQRGTEGPPGVFPAPRFRAPPPPPLLFVCFPLGPCHVCRAHR